MTAQIQPIQSHQIGEAKRIIAEVNLELWQLPLTLEELLAGWEEEGVLQDIDNV
ncbi:MAG TPA: hypothetical protein VFB38_11515 [Chthonomonadaceae bacterium]|nr:hypothetical protein [Chthonomonadaceae bacterium]